jgi:hypothetical protein
VLIAWPELVAGLTLPQNRRQISLACGPRMVRVFPLGLTQLLAESFASRAT